MPLKNFGNSGQAGDREMGMSEEVQRMAMIGRLTSSVIHDLNNFLTVIQLNAEVLAGSNQPAQGGSTMAGEIVRACTEASTLTRNLLALARGKSSRRTALELGAFLSGLVDLLRVLAGPGDRILLELPGEPLWVEGDRAGLSQVFMNLIINAIDAGSEGSIRVTVERDGPVAGIAVIDHGCGIAREALDRIFDPFFTTKETGEGTGLGLPIVQRIVSEHGGHVKVESQVGQGTTFRVTLPLKERTGPETDRGRDQGKRVQRQILLVEDDPGIRMVGRQILERNGYLVREAANAAAARSIWQDHHREIDVLFCDVVLPEGPCGRDLARELQASKPSLQVLLTSGNGDVIGAGDFREEENFLPKPFRPAELVDRIGILLR